MYKPIQIPYILSKEFSNSIKYSEEIVPSLSDFLICFWEMQPKIMRNETVKNIIITDGCIDLVVDYDGKCIGFAGMDKTDFNFEISLMSQSFGARFKPSVFYEITGINASKAINTFLSIDVIDKNFDIEGFFSLPIEESKSFFKSYVKELLSDKTPNKFTTLFDKLTDNIPVSAKELYNKINYSPRQSQRLFLEKFGITPQAVICILRFQKCLEVLTSGKASPVDLLNIVNYYDQAHMINDFKKHIGITPFELVAKYK